MLFDLNGLISLIKGTALTELSDAAIKDGYCGDFLSFVISKVPENAVWFTVMTNANVAAVAKLGEVAAVVVCDGVKADERLIECCKKEGINLVETKMSSFECARLMGQAAGER